jgi:hypothetical protein
VKIRRTPAAWANAQRQGEVLAGKRRLDGGGSRAGRTWRHCSRRAGEVSRKAAATVSPRPCSRIRSSDQDGQERNGWTVSSAMATMSALYRPPSRKSAAIAPFVSHHRERAAGEMAGLMAVQVAGPPHPL